MILKYIIVEDNPSALANLKMAMKDKLNFKHVGYASSIKEAVVLTHETNPHLVFLEVEIGNENGFDVMKEIRQFTHNIPFFILTTDFEKYAKEAVNKDVLYFLEKPINPDELTIALKKVILRISELQSHITIKNSEGYHFIDLNTIHYIKADGNNCLLHLPEGRIMVVTKTMKYVSKILPHKFVRTHKSFIINKDYVSMLNTSLKTLIIKSDGESYEIPIGRSYLKFVRNVFL